MSFEEGSASLPEEMLIVTKTEDMNIVFQYFGKAFDPLTIHLGAKLGGLILEPEL